MMLVVPSREQACGRSVLGACLWREPTGQLAANALLLAQHAIEYALIDAGLDRGAQDVGEHVGR